MKHSSSKVPRGKRSGWSFLLQSLDWNNHCRWFRGQVQSAVENMQHSCLLVLLIAWALHYIIITAKLAKHVGSDILLGKVFYNLSWLQVNPFCWVGGELFQFWETKFFFFCNWKLFIRTELSHLKSSIGEIYWHWYTMKQYNAEFVAYIITTTFIKLKPGMSLLNLLKLAMLQYFIACWQWRLPNIY